MGYFRSPRQSVAAEEMGNHGYQAEDRQALRDRAWLGLERHLRLRAAIDAARSARRCDRARFGCRSEPDHQQDESWWFVEGYCRCDQTSQCPTDGLGSVAVSQRREDRLDPSRLVISVPLVLHMQHQGDTYYSFKIK